MPEHRYISCASRRSARNRMAPKGQAQEEEASEASPQQGTEGKGVQSCRQLLCQ